MRATLWRSRDRVRNLGWRGQGPVHCDGAFLRTIPTHLGSPDARSRGSLRLKSGGGKSPNAAQWQPKGVPQPLGHGTPTGSSTLGEIDSQPDLPPQDGAATTSCAILRNCAASATGSTPSAFITASTMGSDRISVIVRSQSDDLIEILIRRPLVSSAISFSLRYSLFGCNSQWNCFPVGFARKING